jgi:outer membrane protein assembly factor BamA
LSIKVLLAQDAQDFAGRRVTAIQYEPRDQPIDARDLVKAQTVAVGKPLNLNQVGGFIDRLYASGLYQDIKVYAEPQGDGIVLRIVTVPQRFIGHVQARGKIKDPPNSSVILGEAQLSIGTPFDPEIVETARKNIENELKVNGLFKGTVGVTTIDDKITHQVTIGFVIDAGKRAKYDQYDYSRDWLADSGDPSMAADDQSSD